MRISCNRIYNQHQPQGYRVLVDRLWPRGITKQHAALDEWCKQLAPSPALRTWFNHDPARWEEFGQRYSHELTTHREEARALLSRAGKGPLVLLSAARDEAHAHALVLREFLASLD